MSKRNTGRSVSTGHVILVLPELIKYLRDGIGFENGDDDDDDDGGKFISRVSAKRLATRGGGRAQWKRDAPRPGLLPVSTRQFSSHRRHTICG